MQRRQVVTGLLACTLASVLPSSRQTSSSREITGTEPLFLDPINDHENRVVLQPPLVASVTEEPLDEKQIEQTTESAEKLVVQASSVKTNESVNGHSTIQKSIDFARDYNDDIFVSAEEEVLLASISARLARLQNTVGYGNFNILNFDEALIFARRYSQIGEFTPAEKEFIDKVFTFNAQAYGFYGEKVTGSLTTSIKKSSVFKVPGTGHYLFKDQSLAYYEKIRQSVGEGIVLTSGVRSNVKQLHLFLAKVIRVKGNLSRASRSLAPPGYSYHGIGDFDVGRKGWGARNFTDDFAQTDEFKRMQDLGYIAIRYDHGNTLGVRFEPWHIQVV